MFAAELHIPPWQIGELTIAEFRSAIELFDDLIAKAEAAKK